MNQVRDKQKILAIVGAGAAGMFAAIMAAQTFPNHIVRIYEKTRQPLAKVKISGGGRCNVTHACFDPALLVRHYPRGSKELRGAFSRFQPLDTIQWFSSRGIPLKTEEDGRMFPETNQSETIIQCLRQEAQAKKVELVIESSVDTISTMNGRFSLSIKDELVEVDRILLATGGAPKGFALAQSLGHTIVPAVPSLFTLNLPNSPFLPLAGVSVDDAEVSLPECAQSFRGPVLFTHWGVSGPAVLKLSAWAARELFDRNYKTLLEINWLPNLTENNLLQILQKEKQIHGAKQIGSDPLFPLPRQLWRSLVHEAGIPLEIRLSQLSTQHLRSLQKSLQRTQLRIDGKTTYKQEFVTCGGVALDEVDFKTMQSKCVPGLFFAGEILNIDGVTGGFNFQNAWTTGWIAGQSMGL